ncbi:RNA polymerase sigma factor (sigma-70 family) [Desulfitispora alkaliphila]|uniref:RNA polymerase sigma factor n=1 Tax=Desulfitispora alkaliphila TaxID=622674 RepID=UPI003D23C21A
MIGENQKTPIAQTNEELAELVKSNDMKAAETLYFQNIGLIKKLSYYACNDIEEIEDYLQQSFIILYTAAKKYDPARGAKFSTFLFTFLNGALSRYRYQKGVDKGLASIDETVHNQTDTNVVEMLADPEAEFEDDVIEEVAKEQLKNAVEEILGEIPPDLAQVLRLRMQDATLKECAAACGVSSERVRQKQRAAEKLLKKPEYADRLRPFYTDDEYLSEGLKRTNYSYWKYTGYSSTEKAVERILEKEKGWYGNGSQKRNTGSVSGEI